MQSVHNSYWLKPFLVKTTPQMTRFRDAKCGTLQMRLTITECSLTTSAQLDHKIQKERTQHLVLRMRGEMSDKMHDTNDNAFHTAHMRTSTHSECTRDPCAHSPVVRFWSS